MGNEERLITADKALMGGDTNEHKTDMRTPIEIALDVDENGMTTARKRPDIKKTELQKINKIYIIANDKDLRLAYELVIKEMMVCYCVESAYEKT